MPKKKLNFEVVPLAEVLRLTTVAHDLRGLANDAQDDADAAQHSADAANLRANKALHKADYAKGSRKK